MEIPIQNIYYLLCYAWNKLPESDIVNVNAKDFKKILDLFAKVLINGCYHLFKRGLDRNYILINENIRGIKGKFLLNHTLKRNTLKCGRTYCEYDEFHHDVIHNQIIKSTIYRLILFNELDSELRITLFDLYKKFYDIDLIKIDSKSFSSIKLHRNNFFYDFLIKICKIINDNLLVEEQVGKYKFKDFLRDEDKMAVVFENFVRNFYRKTYPGYIVRSETITWNLTPEVESDVEFLPQMKTDISIETTNKKIIIDTKYYREALTGHYNKDKFHSANIYQLYAYLRNIESRGGKNVNCEGILLYPTVNITLDKSYHHENHKISFKTINLSEDWRRIEERLKNILI